MRFLADENFPVPSIALLRGAGVDVASVIQDSPGAKDPAVLDRAVREERILLTFDRHHGELIFRHGRSCPAGLVYFRIAPDSPEEPARLLLSIIASGKIAFEQSYTVLEADRVRQRPMPDATTN